MRLADCPGEGCPSWGAEHVHVERPAPIAPAPREPKARPRRPAEHGGTWTYTLTTAELLEVERVADEWDAADEARTMQFPPPAGATHREVQVGSIGAELAASRLTGLPRNGRIVRAGHRPPRRKAPDLSRRVEVRWGMGGQLRLGRRDRSGFYAVLATGGPSTYTLRGWIEVDLARVPANASPRYPGTWLVRPEDLHPMASLPEDA